MSQKLPVNGFEWVEEEKLSKFNEDFITVIQDIFLE